jgi:hypothetical protein
MKRHPALIPLSRDHHIGLMQALRLRHAADGDASARLATAREFVEFFRNEERGMLLRSLMEPVARVSAGTKWVRQLGHGRARASTG